MSTDKVQALDQALAEVFAESPLISTPAEPSHPVFDHEAFSGIFSEPPPISISTQPSHPNFDQEAFAEILSQPHPISGNTRPSHPNFDQQASAEILSRPPPISTAGKPSYPAFDQSSLAEILSQPSPNSTNAKSSPPGFDHQALAEILSEPRPVQIDPQLSPFFDTAPTSAPLSGQIDSEASAARTVAVAPSTDAEGARPQRARSLLAKLHHILTTKAEPPPSGIEKDPSPPADQLDRQEPATKVIAAAFPANDEDARPQQAKSPPTELPPPSFRQEPSSPHLKAQPGSETSAVNHVAAPSPTDTATARPPRGNSLLVETSSLSATDTASPPVFEKQSPLPIVAGRQDNVDPAAEIVAVALPANTESARPQPAMSLLAVEPPAPNSDAGSSPADFTTQPSPATPSDNLGLPATTVAGVPAKPPLQIFEKAPARLNPASKPVSVAPPTGTESAVVQQPEAKLLVSEVAGLGSTERKSPPPVFENEPSPISLSAQPDLTQQAAKFVAAAAPPADAENAVTRAQQAKALLAELDLNTAIRLRWVMRDIRSKRTKLSPVNDNDLTALMGLGFVEIQDELPRLTALGVLALD